MARAHHPELSVHLGQRCCQSAFISAGAPCGCPVKASERGPRADMPLSFPVADPAWETPLLQLLCAVCSAAAAAAVLLSAAIFARHRALACSLASLKARDEVTEGLSDAAGPSRAKPLPRALRRALLMLQVNAGSRYRCGKRT